MMTQLGRVVYDRKKNIMRPRDIARILSSYSDGITGSEFGKFVLNILELTIKKESRTREFEINFWRYFLNAFNRAALEEIFIPQKFREPDEIQIPVPAMTETQKKPVDEETYLEKTAREKREK